MSDEMLEEDFNLTPWSPGCFIGESDLQHKSEWWENNKAVSYTHLTLPTKA